MEARIDQFISGIFEYIVNLRKKLSFYHPPEAYVIAYRVSDQPDLFNYRSLDIIHSVVKAAGYNFEYINTLEDDMIYIHFDRRSQKNHLDFFISEIFRDISNIRNNPSTALTVNDYINIYYGREDILDDEKSLNILKDVIYSAGYELREGILRGFKVILVDCYIRSI